MTKDELIQWLISKGYHVDKFGHYQKVSEQTGKNYRYKIQDISVRYEVQSKICGKNEWCRIMSGYFKDLSINDKGQLCGLKR
jgi:hypothetical protein